MGMRFRKSFGGGPFRATVSKSGVGWSVGTKGARVAKKSGGGFRTSVGSGGVSFVKDSGGRKKKGGSGCLASILAVLLFFCCLGACGGETEAPAPEPEEVVTDESMIEPEEVVSTSDTPEEPEAEPEPEVIELEPVFVDPFGGEKDDAQPEPEPEPEPAPEQIAPEIPAEPVVPEAPSADPQPPVVSDPLTGSANAPDLTPAPEPEPEPITPPVIDTPPQTDATIVYRTKSGSKYHLGWCQHLSKSKIEITLDEARNSLEPCSDCNPPQ